MADTFDERFSGAPELTPGTEGNTFANPEVAKKYMAQYADQPVSVTGFAKYLGGFGSYLASQPAALLGYFGSTLKQGVERGSTTEDYIGAAFGAATMDLLPGGHGAQFKMPEGVLSAARDFHEQVMAPTAERAVSNPGAIAPVMGSDVSPSVPRSELALTGKPHIDGVINHPVIKNVIDNPIIDREHEIPNSWGGSVPIDNPVTYIDKEFPRALAVDGVTFDPAHGAVVHENIEEFIVTELMKGGMSRDAALRAAYWGWGNPAEHAVYRAHGMNPDHVEAALKPYLDRIAARKANPANIPDDLFKETYPDGNPLKDTAGAIDRPSPDEMARAKKIIADWQAIQQGEIVAYHGTAAEKDFGVNFDVMEGTNLGEHGVSFFSPEPRYADAYTSTNARARERITAAQLKLNDYDKAMREKYGTRNWQPKSTIEERQENLRLFDAEKAAREAPEGAPGPRIIPVRIAPGKTKTFDVAKLFGEEDKQFHEAYREVGTNPDLGHTPPIYKKYAPEERQRLFNERLEELRGQYRYHEEQRARILEETKNEEGGPHDIGPWKAPLDLIAPVVHLAKQLGLDTARVINLAEHGEQIIALNPKNISPYFTPSAFPLQEARELGVIGPERLPHPEDTPAQAAQRAIPASIKQDPNDKITMTPGGEPIDAYQKRFAEWVSKIKHPGDIDNLIMQAAKEENFFEQTRESREIPAAQIEELAKVTGFDSTKFDAKQLRTKFATDAEFRMAAQIMFQARDDAVAGMERMRNAPSPENMDAAFETYNRFKVALRYTAAFRQDWGKAGHAQQEILDLEKRQVQYNDRARNGVPKPVNDLVAAVDEFGRGPSKSGLDKLLGTIEAAEKELEPPKPPQEGEPREPQPKPSPELTELVRTARAVADLMNVERPKPSGVDTVRPLRAIVTEREPMPKNALAGFNRLLSQAERTAGEKQAAIQRAASKQLPPDLQSLIDKADFVTKRFGGIERERAEAQAVGEATAGLDKGGFSYVLGKAFEMSKNLADHTDKLFWLRNNWLLSGPITHTFYFGVNAGTAVAKHILTPPVAALMDRVRGGRNVFFGEAGAGALGLISGVPGAWRAGMTAARTGLRVPLESELRLAERGEESPQARGSNIPYLAHASPDWGALKTAADWLGVPMAARNAAELMAGGAFGRFANMQHTIFKVLGESAQAHRNAYVATAKEGLSPLTDKSFADRYTYHLKNPTDDALRDNVNAGFEGTFMQKLGPKTQRFASALKDTPLRWEFPFLHVPLNITRMGVSYSPLAFFGPEMRAQLFGQRGARSQATALAQVGIGTALLSYVTNLSLQGKVTGDYPPDPERRKQWKAEGIQPNSMLIGNEWVSYNRFGPARIPMTIGANLGAIIKDYDTTKATDEEMAKAVGTAIVSTIHATSDEVGMLAMHNTLEAMNGQRGMAQYGAGFVASFLPYNVGAGQIAAFNDPYARQAKSFMDNIKYRIPYLRETLPATRDAVYGEPLPNPAYHSLVRSVPATPDPVKVELDRLGYHPNSPQAKIGHVQLTPQQYEKYEVTAGQAVKRGLNELMYDPAYAGMNDEERGKQARAVVRYFRGEARNAMQIDDLQLPLDGRSQRLQQITGQPAAP